MWKDEILALHKEIFSSAIDLTIYEKNILFKEQDHTLIGYVLFKMVDDFVDLHYLVVAPSFRRLGHGFSLMEKFLMDTRSRGAKIVTLEVRSDNEAAINLYRNFGFEDTYTRRNYYKDGCDGRLMMLKL